MQRWTVGDLEVVRIVDFELGLPPERPPPEWVAEGGYSDAAGGVLLASSAFAVWAGQQRIIVDPWLAFDVDRDDPAAAAEPSRRLLGELDRAGFPADDVDIVVNTHVDGVGHNVRPDAGSPSGWAPAFPRARYRYPEAELALWDGDRGLAPLLEADVIDPLDPPEELAPGVSVEAALGHSEGHTVVRLCSGADQVILGGHLFLSPLQVADPSTGLDAAVEVAEAERRRLLSELSECGGLLLAPLMGGPGGGRVSTDGTGWRLAP